MTHWDKYRPQPTDEMRAEAKSIADWIIRHFPKSWGVGAVTIHRKDRVDQWPEKWVLRVNQMIEERT